MSRSVKLFFAFLLIVAITPVSSAMAQTGLPCDYYGTHANGAIYCITVPPVWNGDLVVFAHGYVSITEPVGIPQNQLFLPDGTNIIELITGMGYAFATTSYSENGLAVVRGGIDILDLMDVFHDLVGEPNRAYLVGASEGGLVTTLTIENHPGVFDGGMSLCGPIGDFNEQIDYWGNFRVAFDYYFPGVLPPSPIDVPPYVMDNWESFYLPGIGYALSTADPATVAALLTVGMAPTSADPAIIDPANVGETVLGILWYNVFATNNGIEVLGGQPFDNHDYVYADPFLNAVAPRFTADKKALNGIEKKYETSGKLKKPLIVLHTTGDPIVPYWHATYYASKVNENSKGGAFALVSVPAYGHCNFNQGDVLGGFTWLVDQTTP